MSASKPTIKEANQASPTTNEGNLRVLSSSQNAQVKSVAKDWQYFSYKVFSKMFDKL